MKIELTQQEANTLLFYLQQAIIDAEGMAAIGFKKCRVSAKNLRSVINKIKKGYED